jgi:hypothetical protein
MAMRLSEKLVKMGRVVIHPEPRQADSLDSHARVGENEEADSTTQRLVLAEANVVQSLLTIVRLFHTSGWCCCCGWSNVSFQIVVYLYLL